MRSARRSGLLPAVIAALSIGLAGLGCGGGEGGGDSGDAKALLERAFANEVQSGELRLDVKADLEGGGEKLEKPIALRVSGPYDVRGERRPPRLDWNVAFRGAGLNVEGALISTADNAFVELQGQAYELGERAFASLARRYGALQPGRPRSLGPLGLDPTSWLKDPQLDDDGEEIGGEATRKVTGSVDVRRVAEDVVELTRSPRLRRELERQGRPAPDIARPKQEDIDRIEDAVKDFDIEVNVDRDDVVRRLSATVDLDAPREKADGGVKQGRISFSYVLTRVNTNPVIRAPQNAKPLQQLLGGLGLGALGGGDRR